jgi:WS/DGAT/MGAT family acyltransferase
MITPALPRAERRHRRFEAMTGLDSTFLLVESSRTPMHVGALSIFEGAPFHDQPGSHDQPGFDDESGVHDESGAFRLDRVRAHVAGRLHLVPRLRKRIATAPGGLGRPVWVDDEDFDLSRHVRHLRLTPPASRDRLADVAAGLMMQTLDRAHPLWELWFVDGLEDGTVAVLEKVHHAMVDGIADVDLAAALLDLDATVRDEEAPAWTPAPPPSGLELALHSGSELGLGPLRWAVRSVSELRSPASVRRRLGGLADALWSLGWRERPIRTSLDRQIGEDRTLRWLRRPLPDVQDAAHRHHTTMNDLVLAAVAGGLRELLVRRNAMAWSRDPLALVPVSTRGPGQHDASGNLVSALLVPLPVERTTPEARLSAIHDAADHHKARHVPEGAGLLVDALEAIPPCALGLLAPLAVHHQALVDVVVTNVPGPPVPLWFDGARMLESVPILPLAGNLPLSVAILSYDDQLSVGILADPAACPDLDHFTDGVEHDLDRFISDAREGVPI